ncbi:MAG: MgtC/SapB family protein [Desulfobulbaceae bacterium]|nr:MgtC/SapB family protein [Desulfobulbaceae bacterium]
MQEIIIPLTLNFWLHLGLTVLCGGVIGLERQLRGKAAGIRTSILICLGTQTFVSLSVALNVGNSGYDPSRVLGQVVTGIGFIGAGVIMGKGGEIKGVTSAAIIWMLAAIGSAIGLGYLAMAATLTLMTVGVLIGVEILEATYIKLRRGVHRPSDDESDD